MLGSDPKLELSILAHAQYTKQRETLETKHPFHAKPNTKRHFLHSFLSLKDQEAIKNLRAYNLTRSHSMPYIICSTT